MGFSTNILVKVARQILIYGGLTMTFFGIVGSLAIVFVFSRHPFNKSSFSIYIKVNGILSAFFLPLLYMPTIVTNGFQINLITLNNAFCKFLSSYGAFTVLSVLIINWFLLFDRFAISSRSARIRSLSSKKIARVVVFSVLFVIFCLVALPSAIIFEKMPMDTNVTYICSTKSRKFLLFGALFYFPIVEGILPIVLTIFFWLLTRKQVRNLCNEQFVRHFDRQLTRMYLFQILANAIASVPYATINLYRSITFQTVRSPDKENIVEFFRLMAIWLFYVQYCTDFYIYITISKDVRVEVLKLLCSCPRLSSDRFTAMQSMHLPSSQSLKTASR
ncbi:unnamed protein product [Rotaria socialis]